MGLLLAACVVAIVTDVRTGRIPNWLTGSLFVVGILSHVPRGAGAVLPALGVAAAVLAAGGFAHRGGIFGGGDVKLIAAGAGAVSYPDCLPFIVYTFLGGGLLAASFALMRGRLRSTLCNVRHAALTRTAFVQGPSSVHMPYAVAVAFGAALTALADTVLPAVRLPI